MGLDGGEPELSLLIQPGYEKRGAEVATRLGISTTLAADNTHSKHYLTYDDTGLSLLSQIALNGRSPASVRCEFVSGQLRHRRFFGGGIGQTLSRANGISANFKPLIADLTAGLGADGFVLASLGAQVVLVERHPAVAELLRDGLLRLRLHLEQHEDASLQAIHSRLALQHLDGKNWLQGLTEKERPDVIYLDPMFPERRKTAKVKKAMAVFQGLLGDDDDADELLGAALDRARYRVVVKRPRRAPPLQGRSPAFSIEGKTTRFDIYTLKKLPR